MLLLNMFCTMLSLILSGILNMMFTRTKIYSKYKHPIDNFKNYKDGKRIFGDNKTWIGFFAMIIISTILQVLIGLILNLLNLSHLSDVYNLYPNNIRINIIFGILLGFTYMICELPNSFIKRRYNIPPGKTKKSKIGIAFFIIDQVDSLIGVFLLLHIFSGISILKTICYIILGGVFHILLNLVLYKLKIRRNI